MVARKQPANIHKDSDGTFFCGNCGKAGFASVMAARGHLSACVGAKGVLKEFNSVASKYIFEGGAGGGDGGGGALGGGAVVESKPSIEPKFEQKSSDSILGFDPNHPKVRELQIEIASLRSHNTTLSRIQGNHFRHQRPNMGGDSAKFLNHTFVPDPAMRHDPMNFGFSGMPEALGINHRQWAVIKLLGFVTAGYFIYKILISDEGLLRAFKKRMIRKI